MKVCKKCGIEKGLDLFYKTKAGTKDGLFSSCKECIKNQNKFYCINNKKRKKYLKKYNKNYFKNPKNIERRKNRKKERRQTDINFRLSDIFRKRLRNALKGLTKQKSALSLLGCDLNYLKKYLLDNLDEKYLLKYLKKKKINFDWNIDWGIRAFHIDHIHPCASFDLSNLDQQHQCFHYSNLQLLWWKDNLIKMNKE